MRDALDREVTSGYFVDNVGRFYYVKEKALGEFFIRTYSNGKYNPLRQDEAKGLVKIATSQNIISLFNLVKSVEAE